MIPHQNNRAVQLGGVQASASFEISAKDSAHIMGILRDTLYTDKVLAVLREYASNAWDAHRSVGKAELPISVTLPTASEPTLRIRDYGPGLSHEDVFNVYTQYGASTKRNSDDVVGMLGIGSKSGFAYADSFTIISWHDGRKRTYVAVLDESEKGAINLLDDVACDAADTGVEIQIAVRPGDIHDFERTARRLFRHFNPRPSINIELPALPDEITRLTNGAISPGHGEWIATMGCVPYRINIGALDEREVPRCLSAMNGQLQFNIGEVQINASREELKYSATTKAALVAKLTALVDEYVTHALKQLEAGLFSGWESRLRVQVLAKLDLPLPEKWKPLAESFAKVTYTYDQFSILHNKAACTRLQVTSSTCLLIDDTGLDLSGYYFAHDDYVVRSAGKTADELRAILDAVLAASGLTGVAIELLSSKHWTAPEQPKKRKTNPKHRARMFRLIEDGSFCAPWSDCWEPILRTPTVDDVYVVLESFKPVEYKRFFHDYREDKQLMEGFGLKMPEVFGYKTTEKKPVDTSKVEGTDYAAWRDGLVARLLTPENLAKIELYWQAHPHSENSYYSETLPSGKGLKWITNRFGVTHPIIAWVTSCLDAAAAIKDEGPLAALAGRAGLTWDKSAAAAESKALRKRYPLLRRAGFSDLWGEPYNADGREAREEWACYVEMVDAKLAPANNVVQLKSVP